MRAGRRGDRWVVVGLVVWGAVFVQVGMRWSDGHVLGWHGLNHAAQTYQLTQGLVPPTHPLAAGASARRYWPWHGVLALGVEAEGRTPPEVAIDLNAMGLGALLAALFVGARGLGLGRWGAAGVACVAPMLLAPGTVVLQALHFGVSTAVPAPSGVYDGLGLGGWDRRYGLVLEKFVYQGSWATSLGLLGVVWAWRWRVGPERFGAREQVWTGGLAWLAGLFNPFGLAVLDAMVGARCAVGWARGGSWWRLVRAEAGVIAANLALVPYLVAMSGQQPGGVRLGWDVAAHAGRAGEPFVWVWVWVGVGVWVARRDPSVWEDVVWLGVLACVGSVLRVHVINEYKLLQVCVVPASRVLARAVRGRGGGGWWVLAAVVVWGGTGSFVRELPLPRGVYRYEGRTIRLVERGEGVRRVQEAVDWVREASGGRDYVAVRPGVPDRSPMAALLQRRLLVSEAGGQFVAEGLAEYDFLWRVNGALVEALEEGRAVGGALSADDRERLRRIVGGHGVWVLGRRGRGEAPAGVEFENRGVWVARLW